VRSLVVLPGPTGPRKEGRFYPWWNRGRFEIRGGLTVLQGRGTECAALDRLLAAARGGHSVRGFKMPVRRVRPVVALSLIGSAI
jgi:hypothetical protein